MSIRKKNNYIIHSVDIYRMDSAIHLLNNWAQGPVPKKMVKFNPVLSEILSMVFLLRECNSSLQNTVELLLWDTVMIYTKCLPKKCIGR